MIKPNVREFRELVGEAEKAAVAAESGWQPVFSPAPVFRKTGKGG